MYTTLAGAIRARRDARITEARSPNHFEDHACLRTIPPVMRITHETDPVGDILTRSNGVMTRVRMVNTTLRHLGIDCSKVDGLAMTGIVQLTAVQAMMHVGNQPGTHAAFSHFQGTVLLLRDAYQEVLMREDLPRDTAQGILSVARSLEMTAVSTG
jgi:hypothetical protein